MKKESVGAVLITLVVAGCSPYIYKSEINGFSAGVIDLGSAYASGLQSTASERQERYRWQWGTTGARIALTEGCVPQTEVGPDAGPACALREVGKPLVTASQIETQAATAGAIVRALREYADALAAVTNAEDQVTLEAAQAQFRNSVETLAKQRDPTHAAPLGPVADVFAAVTTAALNARRYKMLKEGVTAANGPVAQLGRAMGEALDAIRMARANELRLNADFLVAELGPKFDSADYVSRLTLVEDKVNSLETLQRSDPRKAAEDMVAAHEALTRALNDDRRQTQAVVTSVKAFVDKAKAVREAFAG
jgi:hypothetical protein